MGLHLQILNKIKGTNKTYYDLFKDIICLNKNNSLQYEINKMDCLPYKKRCLS